MNAPGRLVLVLGMHRSGTSALARGLRVLGIALGDDLLPAHPCNPKGFFEDAGLYAFPRMRRCCTLWPPVLRAWRPWICCARKAPDKRFWGSRTRA